HIDIIQAPTANCDLVESQGPRKSRNGNVRNTDSFFKDDSVETRKITLTPNLLRDDSSGSTISSMNDKEVRAVMFMTQKASANGILSRNHVRVSMRSWRRT